MTDHLPDVLAHVDENIDVDYLEQYVQEELRRIKSDPLTYGHPCHAMQEEFISSSSRRRIVVAANRVGKTEGAMRDVLWAARGNHPYRKIRRKCHNVWIGSPDYPSYLRFHRPAFEEWCPKEWIIGRFHEGEKYVDIRREDGGRCRIFFLSYDMPRTKWQGAGVDGIWLDEECPEDILGECLARIVTTQGWIVLTFTPVDGVGWWFDRILEPAEEGLNSWHAFRMPLATQDPDNDEEFNVGESLVPHLDRNQIIEFASEYPDPDTRAIRVFGEVRGRQGLVYKQYRSAVHKIPAFDVPPDWEIWGGLDPGYHGFAALLATIDPMNRVYVTQEYFSQGETTEDRFNALVDKVYSLRPREDWEKIVRPTVVFFVDTEDPQVVLELNTQAANMAENRTEYPERPFIQLVFASIDQGLKARKAGFMRVQQCLAPRLHRATPPVVARERPPVGEPILYFFDNLESEWQDEDGYRKVSRTLWEITHYSWKQPTKTKPRVKPDDGDENSASGAHAMAALRYLIMARLGPPENKEEKHPNREHLSDHSSQVWDEMEKFEDNLLQEQGLVT